MKLSDVAVLGYVAAACNPSAPPTGTPSGGEPSGTATRMQASTQRPTGLNPSNTPGSASSANSMRIDKASPAATYSATPVPTAEFLSIPKQAVSG